MAGPWERYQAVSADAGPWQKFKPKAEEWGPPGAIVPIQF